MGATGGKPAGEAICLSVKSSSLIFTVVSMFGVVLSSSLVAYSFARLRWAGREHVFKLVLATITCKASTCTPCRLVCANMSSLSAVRRPGTG